jgi:hypothetical protein
MSLPNGQPEPGPEPAPTSVRARPTLVLEPETLKLSLLEIIARNKGK